MQNKLRNIPIPEIKYVSESYDFNISTNTEANIRTKLFDIPVTGDADGRIGSKVTTTGIEARFEVNNGNNLTSIPAHVRLVLLYDKAPNKTIMPIEDYFDEYPVGPLFMSDVSLRNRQYLGRFTTIMDKSFTVGSPGTVAGDNTGGNMPNLKSIQFRKKQNKKLHYALDSQIGGIDEQTEGAYYLLAWCSLDASCQLRANLRLTYKDA